MSRENPTVEVFSGIALLFAFHVMALIAIFVVTGLGSLLVSLLRSNFYGLSSVWIWPVFGIGVTQLMYVIPACIYYRRRRRFNLVKGIIIGAILTALLNGGCFLVLSQQMGLY